MTRNLTVRATRELNGTETMTFPNGEVITWSFMTPLPDADTASANTNAVLELAKLGYTADDVVKLKHQGLL
jgi:hypothetical protein